MYFLPPTIFHFSRFLFLFIFLFAIVLLMTFLSTALLAFSRNSEGKIELEKAEDERDESGERNE